MLGSASSISCCNTVINTAVAEELRQFADELENAECFENALHELIKKTIKEHKRIIFNGDGYDEAWVAEAEKRGLSNLKTTPDALAHMLDKKNVELFASHKVFTLEEFTARHEVRLENYCKIVRIEALTMLDMARKDILPAMSKYTSELADSLSKKTAAVPDADCSYEKDNLARLCDLIGKAHAATKSLESDLDSSKTVTAADKLAEFYKSSILEDMKSLRNAVDEMEAVASSKAWPYPSYGELLFGVR